jgi:hypothetical protein
LTEGPPATGPWWRPGTDRALRLVGAVTGATAGRLWWSSAAILLILGGAAAALHLPAGDTFAEIATGKLIMAKGLGATSSFMAGTSTPLDLRSWLLDLGLAELYRTGGVSHLEAVGAVAGAALGGLSLLAIWRARVSHPLAAILVTGIALLALAPLLISLPTDLSAILAVLLVICLQGVREGKGWSAAGLLLLMVAWANLQPLAVVVAPLLLVALALALSDRRRGRTAAGPAGWLLPAVLLAVCINPRGPLIYSQLPLSLGQGGESPLLSGWSSINFHPLTARMAELAGFLLIFGYAVAGSRLRRQDTYLGLVFAVMSLLWSIYLPLFLVIAAVQGSEHLGGWLGQNQSRVGSNRGIPSWALAAALVPALIGLALVARSGLQAERMGGPSQQLSRQLPVAAASWLEAHPSTGGWYTTPAFGDYLATRTPFGQRLVCTSDPVATGAIRLADCEELAVLNQGALSVLERLRVGLAVLPPAAPEVAFLKAEGWRIRYRGEAALVLSPSNL